MSKAKYVPNPPIAYAHIFLIWYVNWTSSARRYFASNKHQSITERESILDQVYLLCRWLLTKRHDKLNHVWYLIFANVNNDVFFKHVRYFITIEIERCIWVFWKFYLMNWRNVNTKTLPPLKLSFKCRVKFSRHNLQLQHCSVRVNYCAPDKKRQIKKSSCNRYPHMLQADHMESLHNSFIWKRYSDNYSFGIFWEGCNVKCHPYVSPSRMGLKRAKYPSQHKNRFFWKN